MYLPRGEEKKIEKVMERGWIAIIKGPRQVGKTTLLKHLQKKYGGTYIDLTDPTWSKRLENDPLSFLSFEEPLFFDEIGYVKGAGRALKLIYDTKKPKIVVSGSGAFEVKENIGGHLVGRASYIELFPLSFEEFVLWKDKHLYDWYVKIKEEVWNAVIKGEKLPDIPEIKKLDSYYEEYVRYGGYPPIVLAKEENKESMLRDLIENQLEKDIFNFFDIREKDKFRELLRKLAYNTANLLRIEGLGISNETAWNYINCLLLEYLIKLLPPYHKNLITELRKTKKLYFYDMGILNVLSDGRISKGQERENFVFINIERKAREEKLSLNYWRTQKGAEVDFLLIKRGTPILPVEVKSSYKKSKAVWSIMEAYKLKNAIIISDENKQIEKNGKSIFYLKEIWI